MQSRWVEHLLASRVMKGRNVTAHNIGPQVHALATATICIPISTAHGLWLTLYGLLVNIFGSNWSKVVAIGYMRVAEGKRRRTTVSTSNSYAPHSIAA